MCDLQWRSRLSTPFWGKPAAGRDPKGSYSWTAGAILRGSFFCRCQVEGPDGREGSKTLEDWLLEPDCDSVELGSLKAEESESLEVLRVGTREARLGWSRP